MTKFVILLLTFLVLYSCTTSGNSDIHVTSRKLVEYKDSGDFIVHRTFDKQNNLMKYWLENKKTKIDSLKLYFSNGKMKAAGQMAAGCHQYIGDWTFYKKDGKIDSTFNYDNVWGFPYFEALEIAKNKKFNLEITKVMLVYRNGQDYWSFKSKRASKSYYETLLINRVSGESKIVRD